jgi:lipoate-protein ligase A
VVDGRKLVGSAQYRHEGAMLQHGSILVEDDQPLVTALAGTPVPTPQPAATLKDALGRVPSAGEVADALFDAVRSLEYPAAREMEPDSAIEGAARRALDRYLDTRWTWRR